MKDRANYLPKRGAKLLKGEPPAIVIPPVVPEDGDPAPDVGPDPVVLPRAAVCNNWERWTEDE